mmetsp:Transcript_32593/g.103206  ORF Transcript_32593/g.103206 Transcript_32593/m.103206 type:complete len:168 (-) Transcript_32593:138-641(-)
MGDTSLSNPKGSVFCVSSEDQLLKPLAVNCLAHPSGIAVSPDGSCVYVAETMANRILRFIRRPTGVYMCSVFHTFSGGFGPTSLACDSKSNLYVCRFDWARAVTSERDSQTVGKIAVLDEEGSLVSELRTPGPEVTGILLVEENESEFLYITEQSTGMIYRVSVEDI